MATIRTYRPDYGGVEVWDDRDPDTAVYLNPAIEKANFDGQKLTAKGLALVDGVMAQRAAGQAEKEAAVNQAVQAEFEKKKAAVADLYDKTPAEAVDAVFGSAAIGEVPK